MFKLRSLIVKVVNRLSAVRWLVAKAVHLICKHFYCKLVRWLCETRSVILTRSLNLNVNFGGFRRP